MMHIRVDDLPGRWGNNFLMKLKNTLRRQRSAPQFFLKQILEITRLIPYLLISIFKYLTISDYLTDDPNFNLRFLILYL